MTTTAGGRLFGADIERREDPALVTGRAEYTDDLSAPGMAHLAFHRSRYAHARIEGIDAAAAEAMDGVLAVYTWDDVEASGTPGIIPVRSSFLDADVQGHPVLCRGTARYQGEPIAAVVAEDRYAAADAAAAVEVSYDPLDVVTDPAEADGDDAPALYEAAPDNVANDREMGDADETDAAFEDAAHVVAVDLVNNRLISNAIEPRAALARVDPRSDRLTVEMTSQAPFRHRTRLSRTLGIPEREIRVIAPAVGGGFGHKGHHHPGEAMASWAARRLDRPVKWTATRSENYAEGAHARDHVTHAELALDGDGTILGLRVEDYAGVGAYGLGAGPAIAAWWGRLLSSQYDVPAIHCRTRGMFTNTAPVHSYRGAGRPEAVYVTERLVDLAARELDRDPVELRRHNQLGPDDFPHETPTGATYDSGDYERALDAALDAADYEALRERQAALRREGRYLGVGVACYVESTGAGFESGLVRVHPDGSVTAYAGTHSHGQGHGTTYAQLVADELGVAYEDVDVVEGDTDAIPVGTGTFGSRSTVTAGSAVAESAREVAEKAREIAAHHLEAAPSDLEFEDGAFRVAGAPDRSVGFDGVARAAYGGRLPDGMDGGLESTTFFEPEGTAYAFGTHVAVVEVDPETGAVAFERYVAVDDCGPRVNPRIVEGQVHGGVAQGIGQARFEAAVYDDAGNLATGSLQDYAVPKAAHVPEMEVSGTVTESPHNPLGVKGIGEAGTIVAPPAVVSAVCDALSPLGVDHLDMPLTDETVWRAAANGEPSGR